MPTTIITKGKTRARLEKAHARVVGAYVEIKVENEVATKAKRSKRRRIHTSIHFNDFGKCPTPYIRIEHSLCRVDHEKLRAHSGQIHTDSTRPARRWDRG